MRKTLILWVDDEIDLLKPHILFLEEKGYEVVTTNNGYDAVDLVKEKNFDLIFLDEMMPGLSGLETLDKIKSVAPNLPVIMITKSEEEDIMNAAIGSKISDYLIKPVNPNQILLSIKKNIEQKRLVSEKTTTDYQTEFGKIGMAISMAADYQDWIDIYKKLVYWEVEIAKSPDSGLHEVLKLQKDEANNAFVKFVKSKYTSWFSQNDQPKPLISPNIFKSTVFPLLENGEKVVFILIDNFRFDQWKTIAPVINEYFTIEKEDLYYAILPTSTQYARNAIFSGLMPLEISQLFPELWTEEDDDEGKNLYEEELLRKQINRNGEKCKMQFEKILNLKAGKKLVDNLAQMMNNDLSVIVYNFVDMLSHART
ncbi:MAG: response regulator, partial [Bacteroidota bacterium]|nr:response regulator [Bacteroidota bacterium]